MQLELNQKWLLACIMETVRWCFCDVQQFTIKCNLLYFLICVNISFGVVMLNNNKGEIHQ